MTVNAVKNKELRQKEPQLSDKYMYQKIPCRGVGKNYKVILKYCIQFNVIINSLYLFIYFIQVQHQATLSCHLPRVAVRQRTTYCGRRHATGTATAADGARDRDGKTK